MQQFKLLGIQILNFKNNLGELISGTNIWVAYADENVKGLKAQRIFLKEGFEMPDIKPNDNLRIYFDMRGKAVNIEKI